MSSDFLLPHQAIEDSEIPSGLATTSAAVQGNNRHSRSNQNPSTRPINEQCIESLSNNSLDWIPLPSFTIPGDTSFALASGGRFHQEQSLSIDGDLYLDTIYPQTNHFRSSWQGIPKKNWEYKGAGPFL